jgi:invasion protein IalB
MSTRNLTFTYTIVLLLFSLLTPLQRVLAQDASKPSVGGQTFGDWIVRCNPEETPKITCVMTQMAVVEESSERLMRINIAYVTPDATNDASPTKSTIQITLPLGILLVKSPQLFLDDTLLRDIPIGICLADGCYSTFQLTDELLEQLLKMAAGHIVLQSGNGEFIKLPISGKGSRAAYNAMGKIATALANE